MAETIKSPAEEAFAQGTNPELESPVEQQPTPRITTPSGRTTASTQDGGPPPPPPPDTQGGAVTPPNKSEFLQRYELAREAGVAPYNWLPPVWKSDKDPAPVLRDTVTESIPFPTEDDFKKKVNPKRDSEQQPFDEDPKMNADGKLRKWPHPRSDFSHPEIHEDTWEDWKKKLGASSSEYKTLKDLVGPLLGPESIGMQRLGLVFEWALILAHDRLQAINKALRGTPVWATYNQARKDYIKFIQDLEDHEPETKHGKVRPGESGYGSCVKWVYIDPVIKNHVIEGASVVLLWNPHSTSSGISIPDQ